VVLGHRVTGSRIGSRYRYWAIAQIRTGAGLFGWVDSVHDGPAKVG
jgi:hypothetical protein